MNTNKNKLDAVPKTKKQAQPQSKPAKPEKKARKPGDWIIDIKTKSQIARPADYTFQNLTELKASTPENARTSRLGLLKKGPNLGLISRGLWLNNNKLKSIQNLQTLTNVLEFPSLLGFLDISCNELTSIHEDLFRFPNITVLYLHGNKINDPADIHKLRTLKKLKHLTIYGNPICARKELGNIRKLVASYLPNLNKLDHNRFTQLERDAPLATQALKILREIEGEPEDWLFKKFPKIKLSKQQMDMCHMKEEQETGKVEKRNDDQGQCDKEVSEFMQRTLCHESCPENK